MAEQDTKVHQIARPGLPAVFAAFFWLGVTSFGGNTAAWLYYQIVQRRHWVTDAEFLSGVALGRTMPGSGGVNLTVLVGQRLCGGAGAVAAVTGLLSGPLAIVLALAIGYTRVGWNPVLHAVLDGIAAAAIGLTFATGLNLLRWRRAEIGPLAVTLATVLCVGVLRWPMIPVVLVPGADQHRPRATRRGAGTQCLTITETLLALALVFVPLSLLSIGGGASLLADMEYQSVTVQGWTTPREFADLFAISRAAPGPGTMLSALIGWKAAGWAGALTATVALYLPSSLLVYGAGAIVGAVARFGLARRDRARPRADRRRPDPVGRDRGVAGVARRPGGMDCRRRGDGIAAVLAAPSSAGTLCRRRSSVRPRRPVVNLRLRPYQSGDLGEVKSCPNT